MKDALRKIVEIVLHARSGIVCLLGLWFVVQFIAWFLYGIQSPVDSELYVQEAAHLVNGVWPRDHELWYISYIFLLAALQVLGLPLSTVVVIQILVSAFALYSIYRIALLLNQSTGTALVAGLLCGLWFEFQQWNLIMYTDSLFIHLPVVVVYLFMSVKRNWAYAAACIMAIFSIMLRPLGIGLLSALLLWFLETNWSKVSPLMRVSLGVCCILMLTFLANWVLGDFIDSILLSYAETEIIYPHINLGLSSPGALWLPDQSHVPVIRFLLFMLGNPIHASKLFLIKTVMFLIHVKPYYSVIHNLFIGSILVPVYFFTYNGLRMLRAKGLRLFILVFVGSQILAVGLTSLNWDGRFLLPALPWLFLTAAIGAGKHIDHVIQSASKLLN